MIRSKAKLGVLVSGRGSNLQAILDHIEKKKLQAQVSIVISNNPTAKGLQIAEHHKIPYKVISLESQIMEQLKHYQVDLVILAGYMKIVGALLLDAYPHKILNIHPSLLPAFPGLHAQKQALDYGVKISGCTVHFVDDTLDGGPIILQESVRVKPTDSVESLSKRILKKEHQLYSKAIQLVIQNKL